MKVLILTQHFPPDLSAGSFRMEALVSSLKKYKNSGLEIDLITTVPNRYSEYNVKASIYEDNGWIKIHRISIPKHNGQMIKQTFYYLRYIMGVLRLTRKKRWDLIFATSSKLMTAVLASFLGRLKNIPYILDIRDLFIDNLNDIYSKNPIKFLLFIFEFLEKKSYRNAILLNVVSDGFTPYIKKIAPNIKITNYTNGIDSLFIKQNYNSNKKIQVKSKPLVLYAGNIGEGQGIHKIIPKIAKIYSDNVRFRIIGSGSKLEKLKHSLILEEVKNVEILKPINRFELIKHYQEADILFVHLNNYNSFKKVLPSKVFEYGATGKPILAGVSGFSAAFIKREISNSEVFEPLDTNGMVKSLNKILNKNKKKSERQFVNKFSREKIMEKLSKEIMNFTK